MQCDKRRALLHTGWGVCRKPRPPHDSGVDRGDLTQAAVKAAHLEEDVLLRAGGEALAAHRLDVLDQAEPCEAPHRNQKERLKTPIAKQTWAF
ncbi:hypothetical protein ANANG_G00128710 [Anguilla anguilla]|uniref:Uncharacterized protein n=1 Tax=Anguilla anguilla TaxID=7936 RepID=A0A9D3S2B3_ANGAN|nr:hypothetical protein ANANG_G00128710 [Anguilla anguilla]